MKTMFEVGQRVIIRPVVSQNSSLPDSAISPYIGQTGQVTDYYWINTPGGGVHYIYAVSVDAGNKIIVLHEDEIGKV